MPEPKRPLKVFLSYASQDKPLVRELSRRLVGEGWIETWQDEKNLLPGQDWRVKIEEAVEEADVVIIVLSQNSVSKEGHVQKELRYAREIALEKPEDAIFLIPLRLDECEVPRGLRFYQWVDYFGERKNDGYNSLVESLQLRYEQKLKQEEEESARQEKVKKEREATEKIIREKAEKETAEKAQLEVKELARQKVAKEKAERESAEKAARKQVEKEAAEKAEAEEQVRQKAAKEKAEREAVEKIIREKQEQEAVEKARLEAEELARQKAAKEKAKRNAAEKAAHEKEKLVPKPEIKKPQGNSNIIYWIVGVFATVIVIWVSSINGTPSDPVSTPTHTSSQSSAVVTATKTPLPIPITTKLVTSTPKSLPSEITDAKGMIMRFVPAAKQSTVLGVVSSDFYMDVYEITNANYKACVNVGTCTLPWHTNSQTRSSYYDNQQYTNYPVIYIALQQAKSYCEWRGARLPTPAEWVFAYGNYETTYPWGETIDCSFANYLGCQGDTTSVDSYEKGKSPYGIYNLVGNVREWVNDGQSPYLTGGAWNNSANGLLGSNGASPYIDSAYIDTGFRCVKFAP